ncbi:hypothetical protein [Streptomyces chartreusis]|uniref:hypothetical protein n=1 Tax=Streptomyces chartreusis TaxID=1969 RepID=UPI00381A41FB
MAPDVELPNTSDAQAEPESVVAVRAVQQTGTAWSVTLAAQYADGTVRYFAVPVAADRAGSAFTVTGAAGVVAGPVRAEVPKSPYSVPVPEGDLTATVGAFLAAYLTGTGEVDRYLAPRVVLAPISPAPYRSVEAQRVSAVEEAADGTKVRVLAHVEVQDVGGR